jgi:hypothetical protein
MSDTRYIAYTEKLSDDKKPFDPTRILTETPVEDLTDNELVYELTKSRLRYRQSLERIEEIEAEMDRRKQRPRKV